ncbi:MAG: DUF721 domain-containing protein [Planctomycetota bacterium]|nr:DUF721 domain-containing protein [Planctomycetota bacterium]
MQEWQLRNVWRNRQPKNRISALSEPLTALMKNHLARRVRRIGQLSIAWDECVPDFLRDHSALVSLNGGVLTVAVDSAAHRYRLEMLLRAGLLDAIRERFSGALNRVRLIPGEFDALEMPDKHPPQA